MKWVGGLSRLTAPCIIIHFDVYAVYIGKSDSTGSVNVGRVGTTGSVDIGKSGSTGIVNIIRVSTTGRVDIERDISTGSVNI